MFGWVLKIIDRIFAVIGALLFSQLPLYMLYYTQQLQGHVAELKLQVDAMGHAAAQTGKSLHQYVLKFLSSTDADFNSQGHFMQGMIDRFDSLSTGLQALHNASVWERPYVFFKYFNIEIAKSTWSHYKVGVPLSFEGAIYALFGILAGLALFFLLKRLLSAALSPWMAPAPIVD